MNARSTDSTSGVQAAIEAATAKIAPAWPLDRSIAVNPLWGYASEPLVDVAAHVAALSGARLTMPRAWYRAQLREGALTADLIDRAILEARSGWTADEVLSALREDSTAPRRREQVTDVAEACRADVHPLTWGEYVRENISQHCAGFFDRGQATWKRAQGRTLYASWREAARLDRGPELSMASPGHRERVAELPQDPQLVIRAALLGLGVAERHREHYLTALLFDVWGWASWCAGLRWNARLDQRDDDAIVDLLAIRIAWEWLLYRAGGVVVARRWTAAMAAWAEVDAEMRLHQQADWLLQRALELGAHEHLAHRLPSTLAPTNAPRLQAVFCIDVRSEVMRRALESQSAAVQTLGFAGFFGLPIAYQAVGSPGTRPQLPGLLAPRFVATDTGPDLAATRARRMDVRGVWKRFRHAAISGFSFVESAGLAYGPRLVASALGVARPTAASASVGLTPAEHDARKPRITRTTTGAEVDLDTRVDLAAGVLRGMGLTRGFAPLVLLVGHGGQTVNNPHAAGLDCGACCGQTGEVNARAAAALLNDPAVRDGLADRGLVVPSTTHFVPGLHDTTTDEITLFDLDEVPAAHADDLTVTRTWLDGAADVARAERAVRLGVRAQHRRELHAAMRERAQDWSEVRPEWGLARNTAFIAAPRARTRGVDLDGRAFLHDYRWEDDPGFATLELIMTAPMVVAHWINFQYYASTVDNHRFGSGDKVLHNIVGGGIGVFEGNSGDLRFGLPLQCVHDGAAFVHTPLRLGAFLEAPAHAIERVLDRHPGVAALVEQGWVHLHRIDTATGQIWARRGRAWLPALPPDAPPLQVPAPEELRRRQRRAQR